MKKMKKAKLAVPEGFAGASRPTGVMDVEGTKMRLFERPVKLGKRVSVIDAKTAKEIGYVDGEKVFELLSEDGRYQAYEDPSTGEFMLAYSTEGAGSIAIEKEADNFLEFLQTIEDNILTAMEADDHKRMRLGVSYESKGRKYVTYVHVGALKDVAKYMDKKVMDALSKGGGPEGHTARLIEVVRKKMPRKKK